MDEKSELAFAMLSAVAVFVFAYILIKLFVFGAHITIQIRADRTAGFWAKVRAFIHYLCNTDDLRPLILRNGRFVHEHCHDEQSEETSSRRSNGSGE